MPSPNITFLYNNTRNDLPNSGASEGDDNWEILDSLNDNISFLSNSVYDGDSVDSKSTFKIPESGSIEIPKHCVRKYSEGVWKRIYLAGSDVDGGLGGDNRYVYGVYIDGTSNTAPVLQAWDSVLIETFNSEILGGGIPDNSMVKAVVTTNSTPGDEWEGTPLAGDGGVNSLALDDELVDNPKMLYWNMRVVIPSTANAFHATPVLCVYVTYQ